MHGDDDCADGGGGEQQGDDFKREHVAAHERVADVVTVTVGYGGLVAAGLECCWRTAQPRTAKTAGGDDEADEPGAAEDAVFGSLGAAGEQDGEDDQDGDRADVDENLGEAGELGVELQETAGPGRRRRR